MLFGHGFSFVATETLTRSSTKRVSSTLVGSEKMNTFPPVACASSDEPAAVRGTPNHGGGGWAGSPLITVGRGWAGSATDAAAEGGGQTRLHFPA